MSKIFSSEGIVFKTIKYGETSIIADIYTREKGLKSFIISGVRSAKSGGKAAIIRPCNYVYIFAYEQEGDKLSRLKEIHLSSYYKNINLHVVISSLAIFMLELCRNAIKEKEPNIEMYDFLKDWFFYLDNESNYSNLMHLKFLLEFSYYLGFGPLKNYSSDMCFFDMLEGYFCDNYNPSSIHIIDQPQSVPIADLLKSDRSGLNIIKLTKEERNVITDHLIQFYKLHITGFKELNSLDILRSVL